MKSPSWWRRQRRVGALWETGVIKRYGSESLGEVGGSEGRALDTDPAVAQRLPLGRSDDAAKTGAKTAGHVILQGDPERQVPSDGAIAQRQVHAMGPAADASGGDPPSSIQVVPQQVDDGSVVPPGSIVGGDGGVDSKIDESLLADEERTATSSKEYPVAGAVGVEGQFPAVEKEGSHPDAAPDKEQQSIIPDIGSWHRLAQGTEQIDPLPGPEGLHRATYGPDHLNQKVQLTSLAARLRFEVVDAEGAADQRVIAVPETDLHELARGNQGSEFGGLDLEAKPTLPKIDVGQDSAAVDTSAGGGLGSHLPVTLLFGEALDRGR